MTMPWDDVVDVLSTIAAGDRRTVGRTDVAFWQGALEAGGVESKADAIAAVFRHYAASAAWIMPSHVIEHVNAIRAERLENVDRERLMEDVDPDDGRAWVTELQARLKAIADGAMTDPPRYIERQAHLRAVEA